MNNDFLNLNTNLPKDALALRLIMKKRRLALSAEERASAFQKILLQLFTLPEYRNAKYIAAYYGKTSAGEFDTLPLLKQILNDKKILALPRVDSVSNRLILYQVKNIGTDLEPGVFGLIEPKISNPKISVEKLDLIIVPGLVFDHYGNRYGYGKGYYDGLLSPTSSNHFVKIALALDSLVVDFELIHSKKDIPMDFIITEKQKITNLL